jgi:hypothetical protein
LAIRHTRLILLLPAFLPACIPAPSESSGNAQPRPVAVAQPDPPARPGPERRGPEPDSAPGGNEDNEGTIPDKYVGSWTGMSGKAEAKTTERTGTATVTKDFGHEIKQFEFQVQPDGKITGSGQAVYWFNVTCDAELIATRAALEAHLEGGNPLIDFSIEGQMSPEGRVRLFSTPRSQPTLVNVNKKSPMDVWNVFGPNEQAVKEEDDTLFIDAVDSFPQINLRLAYRTTKNNCEELKKQIQFLQDEYLPFIQALIDAYTDMQNVPGDYREKWGTLTGERDADWNHLQDKVLEAVRKIYPQAGVGAETTFDAAGKPHSKVYKSEEPYQFVKDWRASHEAYHAKHHGPAADDKARMEKSYKDYLVWKLQNEVETYKNVNQAEAKKKLEELKEEYRRRNCGPLPEPAPPDNRPNS